MAQHSTMSPKRWHEALTGALQNEDGAVMQFAMIGAAATPRVRSLSQRTVITASAHPELPLILSTIDVRSPKVRRLAANSVVEVVYWAQGTREQFRILGRASIVPEQGYSGSYPAPMGMVYEALGEEGFDWEAKRMAMFDRMSEHLRGTQCRSVPMTANGAEMRTWKPSEVERQGSGVTLSNFALLLIEPFEVDYLELGVQPNRRTRFERDWKDDCSVEFKMTLVVS